LPAMLLLVEPVLQALALLFLRDVQHELENGGAVLGEDFLEGVDLVVTRFDRVLGCKLAHAADENIFIVRAVEYADEAFRRGCDMRAPQKIMSRFHFARLPERLDHDTERARLLEDMADGAVLAGGVDALQYHEQGTLAFGVELVLKLVDDLAV